MERLKKEWRETQIPPEVRLRAKNRAWDKIQRPVFRMRTAAAAFAVCAVALAVFFAVFRNVPDVPEERIAPAQPIAAENLLPAGGGFDDVAGGVVDVASAVDIGDIDDPVGIDVAVVASTGDIGDIDDPVGIDVAGVANNADVDSVAIVANVPSPDNIDNADGTVAIVPSPDNIANVVEHASNDAPERVVLNFILPESGARLIWIVSSDI